MGYGIFRLQKLTAGNINGIEREHNRTPEDRARYENGEIFKRSEIDFERTGKNVRVWEGSSFEHTANQRIADEHCKRVRKDSIRLFDALYTASPEALDAMSPEEQFTYWRECLVWHCAHLCDGKTDNLISAVIHYDEATPHMHVCSVPIIRNDDGSASLSAKKILGDGNPAYMRELQDSFYDEVSSRFGLERGERSETPEETRVHVNVQRHKLETTKHEISEKALELTDLRREIIAAEVKRDRVRAEMSKAVQAAEYVRDKASEIKAIVEARTQEKRGKRIRSIADDEVIVQAAYAAPVHAMENKELRDRLDLNIAIARDFKQKLDVMQERAERAELWRDGAVYELERLAQNFQRGQPARKAILRIAGLKDDDSVAPQEEQEQAAR